MKYPLLENLWASDIETTGLLDAMRKQPNPRLHNLGLINAESLEENLFEGSEKEKVQAFLDSSPVLIMHNGILFDKEALKLLGYDVSKLTVIDTLFISWYLEPRRIKYGLEEYGEEFGVPKPPIADWESLTQDEYNHRVMQDCRIQIKLWQKQYRQLLAIYQTHAEVMRFINYLMSKGNQLRIQQNTRWKLDIPACIKLKDELDKKVSAKFEELSGAMPKVPIKKIKNRPAKCFKKDKSLSKAGLEWKAICDCNNLDFNDTGLAVMMITGYEKGNPNSHPQLKDWLFSLGWEPETFKFVRNKETNEMKKIPQTTVKDEDGNPDICPSLYKLAERNPDAGLQHLIGYGVLKHRAGICNGFLNNNVDGYLTARCGGLTNTLRLKHRELVNLPSLRVAYGKELRALLTAIRDEISDAINSEFELLGSDLCSLEDRVKHHYQWPYDPEYVKKQLAPDFDPHLEICLMGGMLTPVQVAMHKAGTQKFSTQRSYGKSTNYSCQYGAMPPTVARAAGVSLQVGEQLHKAYWKLNWSIKEIASHTTVKTIDGQMWQLNPVNNFWYSLRYDKDRFSTLCQGTGSYIFDIWCNNVIAIVNERYGLDPKLAGQFHDELILIIRKETRHIWDEILKESMERTNAILKMNREIACDVQYGTNYSEIH